MLLVVTLWYLWVKVYYFGDVDGLAVLSSIRADRPPVPNVPWQLGAHYFGDFLLPYEQALFPNPWVDYPSIHNANSYPPVLVGIFKLLTLLPYHVALVLFLALNAVSLVIPVVVAARRMALSRVLVGLCLLVLLTFPFLMVVDRGNAQGLLVVPLYVFVVAWRERRWRRAATALAVAASLKLYPALLAMVLVSERRFRDAALAVAAPVAVTIVLFDLFPGGLSATLNTFMAALFPFSAPTVERITVSNYSVVGMFANFFTATLGPASPPVTWLLGHPSIFGLLYLAAAAAVVYARSLPFVVRVACALSVLTFAVPLSYGYTLCFVFVVIAELLRAAAVDGPEGELPRPLALALAVALTTTLALWPFAFPATGISVGTVLVPAAWIALTATALVHGYRGGLRAARAVPA